MRPLRPGFERGVEINLKPGVQVRSLSHARRRESLWFTLACTFPKVVLVQEISLITNRFSSGCQHPSNAVGVSPRSSTFSKPVHPRRQWSNIAICRLVHEMNSRLPSLEMRSVGPPAPRMVAKSKTAAPPCMVSQGTAGHPHSGGEPACRYSREQLHIDGAGRI